jgi:putative transposase
MARPLRIEFEGALYHVTSRGNERREIFRSDDDRNDFLCMLGQAAVRFGWSVTAYVLMTNHFHLVIQTPQPNLSRGMHWLNGKYVGRFNRRHKRCGHLFQGRYHAFLIDKESYATEVLRYVVLNPVRAGMVTRPEDYRWSSYRATAGLESGPSWLDLPTVYTAFGLDRELAQGEYRSFVHAAIGSKERLWDKVTNALYLGGEAWVKRMRALVESKPRSTDHPKVQRAVGRPTMNRIIDTLAQATNLPRATVRSRAGGSTRWLAAWLGWNEGLITLRTIAASFRLRSEGHISRLVRRCEVAFAKDAALLATLDATLAALRA